MPGVKRARRDGREDPIALEDEMLGMMGPDGARDPLEDPKRPSRSQLAGGSGSGYGFDLDDDVDLVAEPRRRGGDGLPYLGLLGGLAGLLVVVGGLWLVFAPAGDEDPGQGAPAVAGLGSTPASRASAPDSGSIGGAPSVPGLPIIRAEEEPFKVPPQTPGGLQVENQDKLVYGRLEDGTARNEDTPQVEELLPAPTRPVVPPQPVVTPEPVAVAPSPPAVVAEAPPPPAIPEQGAAAALPQTLRPAPAVAPVPEPAPVSQASAPENPAPENVAATVQQGPQVQLAAFRERRLAEEQWRAVSAAHPDLLGDVPHVIVFADLGDRGQYYRLRAGPLSGDAAARALCQALKQRNVECLIVRE